jgi:hypothetical protein
MLRCDKCGNETRLLLRSGQETALLCAACYEQERKQPAEEPELAGAAADRGCGLPGICGPGKDGINFHR